MGLELREGNVAKMLYEGTDRAAAHAFLDALDRRKYRKAECREDANAEKPYQVWSGPEEWVPAPPTPEPDPASVLAAEDALLDRLAERLVEKLAERQG